MGIDMSRPSPNQQTCQGGHLLIHMKMDVITREGGQQTLTLRCSLCESVLRMSDVSRSELINHSVVTAAGQTLQNSQETNQTDTNILERESSFDNFAIKTELVSTEGKYEDDIGLDMHVESYEEIQLDLGNNNQANSAAKSNQVLPLANNTEEAGTSSVQQIISDTRRSNAPSGFEEPLCKFCKSTEGEFGESFIWGHMCKKLKSILFICSVCNEYYGSCNLVTECESKHRRIKNNCNKEEFKCMVCGIKFADLGETKRHEFCHNSNDSEVLSDTSLEPELNDSRFHGPETENHHTQKFQVMALPAPSNSRHVPSRENQQLTQGAQILPPIISPQEIEEIKHKSFKPESFCVALMAKIFSRVERSEKDTNVLGIKKLKKLCPVCIQFIKDCVHQNYPKHFQKEPGKTWSRCVGAMNNANRSLRFKDAQFKIFLQKTRKNSKK
ncbi:uncharacterized protein LOC106150824 [Lingula anatina]|uniref:Uncharacterized protein LOC106150824 n=1 Tax=Lingula anatina TaxID=7574 RepID=A0A1S3GZV0_LINAN|nr:uncharacterized protein LOC106150824 [Lingula anatina]|eukprot:XP_013379278.1 uncharacterized protein LOC106150824 [Lingula anatina]